MTIRTISKLQELPGSIGDAGTAGAEILGLSSQDHEHSYDDGLELNYDTGLNRGSNPNVNGWQATSLGFPVIFKLGNLVIVTGWLQNIQNAPTVKDRLLFTVPEEFRLSDALLPRVFPGRLMRTGVASTQAYTYDTDHGIKLPNVASLLDDSLRSVSLARIRYVQK